ncbi:MAG: 3-oxoacyl-[acyl-carrier protein] reductase [Actinomycetota bacterium]|nr:3-oxoacyl-[acyl-carrier protein] reductase [Actinomycetota bacterium]
MTGAGRGIGAAVAVRLGREGYRVALTARSEDQLRETAALMPTDTLVLPADMLDPAAPDRVVDAVEEAWGSVEVLVANAGAGESAPIARMSDEMWARQIELNLTAPFRAIRRVVPAMVEQRWGRIVALASVAAKRGEPYIAAYTASKHGLLGLVRSVAAELATKGVTVNAVCPAYVDTPMTDGSVETISAQTGRSLEEARAILVSKQPIARLISVDEVAEAVMFCVANGGMTGQGINVDGGAVQS